MNSEPKLLLCWEPRWEGFKSSLGPALGRSSDKLGVECEGPGTSPRSMACSVAVHLLLIVSFAIAPRAIQPRVVVADAYIPNEITYFAGPYLPELKDTGGAEAGKSGRSGGNEGFHPKQVIRVSRGRVAEDKNIDAPKLRPTENSILANLIAVASAAPAAPADAIRKQLHADSQLMMAMQQPVQPAVENPKMKMARVREFSTSAVVVQPVQQDVVRDRLSTSKLILPDADVVPPAPEVAKLRIPERLLPEEMQSAAVPPAPTSKEITRDKVSEVPAMDIAAVQPAPTAEQLVASNSRGPVIPGYADAGAPSVAGNNGAADKKISGNGSKIYDSANTTAAEGTGNGDQKIQALVISANPGSTAGLPTKTENGSIALSPKGTGSKGLGGSGGGSGIGKGTGPGSGKEGPGSGSAQSGLGAAADINARNGNSKTPGPGGTGDGTAKSSTLAGITVSGGSVTLPSFAAANIPTGSASKVLGPRHAPSITVVGSASAGGALNRYRTLKGGKVYTIYIETRVGTAVLEYAEQVADSGSFNADLTAPEPMQSDFPADFHKSRAVVACVIGRDGVLRNLRVLESAAAETTASLISALEKWRFRPVLRGDEAIAVDAILGFDIDTR